MIIPIYSCLLLRFIVIGINTFLIRLQICNIFHSLSLSLPVLYFDNSPDDSEYSKLNDKENDYNDLADSSDTHEDSEDNNENPEGPEDPEDPENPEDLEDETDNSSDTSTETLTHHNRVRPSLESLENELEQLKEDRLSARSEYEDLQFYTESGEEIPNSTVESYKEQKSKYFDEETSVIDSLNSIKKERSNQLGSIEDNIKIFEREINQIRAEIEAINQEAEAEAEAEEEAEENEQSSSTDSYNNNQSNSNETTNQSNEFNESFNYDTEVSELLKILDGFF